MRNLRFRSAATTATTALVAALALTACGPDDVVNSTPKPDSTAAAGTATDAPDAKESEQPPADQNTDKGNGNDNASDANGSSGSGSDKSAGKGSSKTKTSTCTGDNTNVTVTKVSRPLNHLLVTATNTGSGDCHAYYAPLLGFDEAQAVTQINEDSKPQAVVTLSPGQSAYASIALGGVDGAPTTAAYKLSVHFSGRANEGSEGSSAGPITLPKGTATTADTSVSYWQSTMADALTW
ncbi:DUF4232 domain-containing protein [Streptomyces sp. NPDC058665]|uniref:DUF4232 domain-containing protein n=1 Tax=Streptomyces sp. NPDC058665 TaxID=3346586 RepID=UPI00365EF353